ncbi:hypothetical protein B5S28_g23 [[Candida] boidinii]|uniref:Unnamed protein product n=1 Tax=Candida boidinii TaxID=5477 RepID=A0ACB5TDW4_CANBO|nr:hypothetical protein B5S28_g23 [[Candida] boidinii]OWB59222.1 hypothetical protein B5S29_g76 [[Candida] boidinii]OWB70913.1 hypothetical protein B5S31_g594 [[Candida] boidinii]OWB75940.1 hypothetical protein B5S32_g87 [[Candida] boidinii]GME86946.1 unnamed protein product [[Candida] boidinii]
MSGYQAYQSSYNGFTGDTGYGNGGAGGFTSEASSSQTRSQNTNSVTPCTIKQINDSQAPVADGSFQFNGMELNLITFVGIVREVDASGASSLQLKVEDGTGDISFRKWIEEGEEQDIFPEDHVYVTGTIREFNSKKQLQNTTVRKIEDYNEIIYHYLSAIKTYTDSKSSGAPNSSSSNNNENSDSLFVSNAGNAATSNLEKIYQYIQQQSPIMTEGVPINLICQTLDMGQYEVETHCNSLTEEGRIYSAMDDNAFLAV